VSKMRIHHVLPVLFILLFGGVKFARAQSGDVYFGLGTSIDKSSGQTIDTFGDGNLYSTPKMTGLFGSFGADFMFRPSLGIGGEFSSRFAQGSYAGLNYRSEFYDFNAIWLPILSSKKVVPELQAGIGGANLKFYYSQQFCDSFSGCSTSNTYLESSNHFQAHLGAAIRMYVKGGLFVRPQVDVHYVKNFFQFGSNWVPEYTVSFGYTFGRP
jgi:hypothetical protein